MASESLAALREFAGELAWLAGKLTLRYYQTGLVPDTKADDSPVTLADQESEQLMRQLIEARYPHHSILGEEQGETRPGASFRWILDPIDGTRSFMRGTPLYAVLVGLEREGETVVGAVNMPALGDFLTAAKGQGCQWNGMPARVSPIAELSQSYLLATEPHTMGRYGKGESFERLLAASKTYRGWSDAYAYVLVATGRAEVALDPVMSAWDCAALLPVLQEAGGTFTDWQGDATIHGGEAIATNGHVYDEVMRLVRG